MQNLDSPERAIKEWVENFVIGYNLCPFAKKPMESGQVEILSSPEGTIEDLFYWSLAQVQRFISTPVDKLETLLLVYPKGLNTFELFLDFLATLLDAIFESGAYQIVQTANFHPQYRFEGTEAKDVSNKTNQSPYPVIQLLRVSSVTRAIESYPDVENIPLRNIQLMQDLFGTEGKE